MTRLKRIFGRRRVMAAAVIALLFALAGAPVVSLKAENLAALGLSRVGVTGLTSAENNVAFALDGRYAVIAPFAPTSLDDSSALDNHFLYLVDTENSRNVILCDLDDPATGASRVYPAHLVVSSDNFAFVRVTSVDDRTDTAQEGIAYSQITADKNGKVSAPFHLFFPIDPPDGTDPSLMPTSFGLSNNGQFVCYTDGAQLLVVDRLSGNRARPIIIVPDYNPLKQLDDTSSDYYSITRVDVDPSNVITVSVNGRRNGVNFSQLYFYLLLESGKRAGTVKSLAIVKSDSFPSGVGIAPDSTVAISPDASRAFFATDDGSLWSVALSGSANLDLSRLGTYPSVSAQDPATPGPSIVQYDAKGGRISIVKRGVVPRVRRPSYIKHRGGVRRPSYIKFVEPPGLAVVRLNAQGHVVDSQEARYFSANVDAISNVALGDDGSSYFAASVGGKTGVLMSLEVTGPNWFGNAIPNIKQIAPAGGSAIVGIQDFDFDPASKDPVITSPGGLVFMSLRQPSDALRVSISAGSSTSSGVSTHAGPAIRRPCNVNH